jgi:hypothetical protein
MKTHQAGRIPPHIDFDKLEEEIREQVGTHMDLEEAFKFRRDEVVGTLFIAAPVEEDWEPDDILLGVEAVVREVATELNLIAITLDDMFIAIHEDENFERLHIQIFFKSKAFSVN